MEDDRLERIRSSYNRRSGFEHVYDPLLAHNARMNLERARILVSMIRQWLGPQKLSEVDILEIGCGTGNNLLHLISLGASPERIVGNELLEARLIQARNRLPNSVRLHLGDASGLPDSYGRFDLILQFLVFSSILDDSLLESLASRMWSLLKPGGIVLSYDFVIGNPSNPDVRGISPRKLKSLFPAGQLTAMRLTLVPSLARIVSEKLYLLLAAVPFLKTHCLCAIRKSG
jgi:SAM-dependent methyltransferase